MVIVYFNIALSNRSLLNIATTKKNILHPLAEDISFPGLLRSSRLVSLSVEIGYPFISG
jgi:hypothetical protein